MVRDTRGHQATLAAEDFLQEIARSSEVAIAIHSGIATPACARSRPSQSSQLSFETCSQLHAIVDEVGELGAEMYSDLSINLSPVSVLVRVLGWLR
jgi:hypothetical protein